MIVRSNRLKEGTDISEKNGELILAHTMNIDPILEANYHSKKDEQDGWNKERSMRMVARISPLTWKKWCKEYPEILVGDKELREKTIYKLLYTEEGKKFWTVNSGV
jgi:hypothetical protein